MKKKSFILTSIISFLIIIFLFFTSFFILNNEFRRNFFTKLIAAYNLYQYINLRENVRNSNFEEASNKLIKYINFSEKYLGKRNQMLLGIFDATSYVANNAYTQKNFNDLEKVFEKIVSIEPNLYMSRIWLARSLSDNMLEESIEHLYHAIKLSPSQPEAYRELARINQIAPGKINLNIICNKFYNSQLGGVQSRDSNTFFGATSLNNFAVRLNNDNEQGYYLIKGLSLNKDIKFEIIPKKPQQIKHLEILHSLPAGIKIEISNLNFYNYNYQKSFDLTFLDWTSLSTFLVRQDYELISFFSSKSGNDIITLKFNDEKIVNKISFHIKIEKLGLNNTYFC